MRKILLFFILLFTINAQSQNLQLHYDFGKDRKYLTSTFELFKLDKIGSTFIFIDFDYNLDKEKFPSLAYMEIARTFTVLNSPFSAHIEYNGGLMALQQGADPLALSINNAFLGGVEYGWLSSDFSKSFGLQVLYKYIAAKNPLSFQLTGVWNLDFHKGKFTLAGFADFWREDNLNFSLRNGQILSNPIGTKFVFMSEPQFWYNVTKQFSIGSEVEVGVNFGAIKGLEICPTMGVKWNI